MMRVIDWPTVLADALSGTDGTEEAELSESTCVFLTLKPVPHLVAASLNPTPSSGQCTPQTRLSPAHRRVAQVLDQPQPDFLIYFQR